MKFEIICLLLLVQVTAEDLSCAEDGGWRGLKVKPNLNHSNYTICKEGKCWDLKNVPLQQQTSACEALRVRNRGNGWSLLDDGSAR